MTQLLKPNEYYLMLAFYMIANQAQEEVRKHEKMISAIVDNKSVAEKIADMIYDPQYRGTKKELDDMLLNSGLSIEWKPAKNKFAGQEEREKNVE